MVAIDSALVGPFDLGVVISARRSASTPTTAQVSIDSAGSDPIPHIIDGIPIHLRDIRIYIDRPDFMVNPTSCDPFALTSTLTGSGALFSDPADDTTATATVPFQVFNCSARWASSQSSRCSSRAATKRGAYPSLRVTVTPRPGDANIGHAPGHPAAIGVPRPGTTSTRSAPGPSSPRKPARRDRSTARPRPTPRSCEAPMEGPVYLGPPTTPSQISSSL